MELNPRSVEAAALGGALLGGGGSGPPRASSIFRRIRSSMDQPIVVPPCAWPADLPRDGDILV
ncbi:MAG: hypothetical protein QME77_13080 [bacterium]|nr:hypothetical protein [bacterium]